MEEQAGSNAEIVMGVINDENMQDRVEVILVITGLGARSLEEALPGFIPAAKQQPAQASDPLPAAPLSVAQPASQTHSAQALESVTVNTNLDLPAFLRRPRA